MTTRGCDRRKDHGPSIGRGCDRRKDHSLGPSVGLGCNRCKDHRGIVDTELMVICDFVRESRVKVKLLVVMNDYYGIVIPSLIGS